MSRLATEEDMQMGIKPIIRCPASLAIKRAVTKTVVRPYEMPTRKAKTKQFESEHCMLARVWILSLLHCWGARKNGSHCENRFFYNKTDNKRPSQQLSADHSS